MWTIEVTDFSGNKLGEVHNAGNRTFIFALNRIPTAAFEIAAAHPMRDALFSTDVYVKAYAGADLMHHGLPTAIERVAQRNVKNVRVTSSGPLWRLTKRLAAKNATGVLYLSPLDRGLLAKGMIDTLNAESNTGIRTGTLPYLSDSTTTFKFEPYKPASEIINELGHALDGFDWQVVPIEYTSGKIGDWHSEALIGEQKTEAVFEYGTGLNNISGVEDRVTLDAMANRVFHIHPQQGPHSVKSYTDTASVTARGLYEDIASADLAIDELRTSLVEEHTRVRRYPRRVVSFTPKRYHRDDPGNVPVYGRDYEVGDWVPAHAMDEYGTWFDGFFRVYQATVTVDSQGMETVQLVLTDEG